MQIITDILEARAFVKNMAQSLADAAYWKDWYALEITSKPPLDWIKQAKITALIRTQLPDGDGSVLWLDGSVLIVFKYAKAFNPEPFANSLAKTLGMDTLRTRIASLSDEREQVEQMLAERSRYDTSSSSGAPVATYRFLKFLVPNIENLLHDWHESKKDRTGRDKPHIMVVDDDPLTLRMVGQALERDYTVITARNGAEAIAKHLQLMPDIIFLDIGLPDCDGLTLLNYMQQYDQECQIVMFSADDFLKTKVRAFAGGAKGYLSKPFNLRAFQKYIGDWFSGKAEKG